MPGEELSTTCCIAGGGPAGIMLGYLLARAGVQVTVLEKHGDFFRDFRGDTVHPSTLQVLHELGLLEDVLRIPHQKVTSAGGLIGGVSVLGPDFTHVPGPAKFIALMPQWDFLNFLAERARRFPSFSILMRHEVTGLLWDGDRVTGVTARGPSDAPVRINARLVVGCDGRHSAVRSAARLELRDFGVPIDVLWFRISRAPSDPDQVLGIVNYGKALILLNRGDYFQAGLIVRKGSFDEIRERGIPAFRDDIRHLAPYLDGRVDEIHDWDQVKLLTVQVNRLRRWYRPGLLCVGDAAHAMSPAGGVGINLAVQDAVAAANLLARFSDLGFGATGVLAAIQRRREFPARLTQAVQVFLHRAFARIYDDPGPLRVPWQVQAVTNIPGVHRLLGRAVGIGVRPEHVGGNARRKPRWLYAAAAGAAVAGALVLLARRRRLH